MAMACNCMYEWNDPRCCHNRHRLNPLSKEQESLLVQFPDFIMLGPVDVDIHSSFKTPPDYDDMRC